MNKKRPVPTFVTKCLALAASAENRNEDAGQYEQGVVEPYRRLEQLHEVLEREERQPDQEEMQRAAEWLQKILTTKQIEPAECADRMAELWSQYGTALRSERM